jgi:hypothetical protein
MAICGSSRPSSRKETIEIVAILWFVLKQIASPFATHAARVRGLPVAMAVVELVDGAGVVVRNDTETMLDLCLDTYWGLCKSASRSGIQDFGGWAS